MKNNNQTNSIKPIVFVNNPINNKDNDVVGFDSQVDTIESAIVNGATMIGVVADYGAGKSSVTEMLSNKITKRDKPRKKYPKPIVVNMWDCLQNKSNDSISSEISDLTKSFLFQLANGKSRKLASYINKRLSSNYGLLSLGVNSRWAWVCFIIALVSFGVSQLSKITPKNIPDFPNWMADLFKVIYNLSPMFIGVTIFFSVIGIYNASIAFSHWKTQRNNNNEVNDIFDSYAYIIKKLKPRKKKKQIIIIEDLDRINDKSVIIGFLKELYRFQSSLGKDRNKMVFIVSIKPEANLNNKQPNPFDFDDNKIYSKIFDLTIHLKPIHYDDYDSVLIELLKSNPEAKSQLEELIDCPKITNSLPSSFYWIKKGTNLTIRDLKERLNASIAIMVSLKNKQYKVKTAANFNACAAVTFLENAYPKEYYQLIKNEETIAGIIKETYNIKNYSKESERFSEINNTVKTVIESIEELRLEEGGYSNSTKLFISDLSELLDSGVFDDDFRMYFYSYPKNSHIKTSDEKYICNLLQLPYSTIDDEKLSECANNVFYEHSLDSGQVVINTLMGLEKYPEVILHNPLLLEMATFVNINMVANTFLEALNKNNDKRETCIKYIRSFRLIQNNRTELAVLVTKGLLNSFIHRGMESEFENIRLYFVEALDIEIVLVKDLFFDTILISEDEIVKLNPIIAIGLIDESNLGSKNYTYISKLLISVALYEKSKEYFEKAKSVFEEYIDNIFDSDSVPVEPIFAFLQINNCLIPSFFTLVANAANTIIPTVDIALYLNNLSVHILSGFSECYEDIDNIGFSDDIDFSIVELLISNGFYYTPLYYCTNNKCLDSIPFDLGNTDRIINDIQDLFSEDDNNEVYYSIRLHIVKLSLYDNYRILFNDILITKEEFLSIENVFDAISLINLNLISDSNTNLLIDIINSRIYSNDEIIYLFHYLFDEEKNEQYINDVSIIEEIIYGFDYSLINISILTLEERDEIIDLIKDSLALNNSSNALELMSTSNCLVASLEKVVQDDKTQDEEYVNLLNRLHQFTDATIEWIEKTYVNYPLCPEIYAKLKEKGSQLEYIVGASLYNHCLVIDESVPIDDYFTAYDDYESMFDLMKDNAWFLEKLRDTEKYDGLDWDKLKPLLKVDQTTALFTYVFDHCSKEQKMEYLWGYEKFKTEEDSKNFQKLICSDTNIDLIKDEELKEKIRVSLWESNPYHKMVFTKAWNRKFAVKKPS